MQGCAKHGYLLQEKQEAPQGGLQAMSCGIFSMQHCSNQCTPEEA